ncbi:hypothetical protein F5Y15DRAFT_215237 [Xylariaceae sp. FL0016]|nr:hypothetical protein F5Y15DRAFT_215237 [Xylariaceae sp. FL0016]
MSELNDHLEHHIGQKKKDGLFSGFAIRACDEKDRTASTSESKLYTLVTLTVDREVSKAEDALEILRKVDADINKTLASACKKPQSLRYRLKGTSGNVYSAVSVRVKGSLSATEVMAQVEPVQNHDVVGEDIGDRTPPASPRLATIEMYTELSLEELDGGQ